MIFCNGDSITFGCELHKDDLDYIEKHRFSNIIAQKLDKEVINISSIKRVNNNIVRSTIKWIEENGNPEFAIIQFGPDKRFEWYSPEDKKWTTFGPSATSPKTVMLKGKVIKNPPNETAVSYYSNVDNLHMRQMNMWTNIFFMETYLNYKGIPHYFWYGKGNPGKENRKYDDLDIEYKEMSKWSDMKEMCDIIGTKNKHPENFPKSNSWIVGMKWGFANGIHPNENGHELLAEHFLEYII
tara:strand:- start:339 stop:1058 length:720 start_codon:yes stop_codon:yes gene_type:complete